MKEFINIGYVAEEMREVAKKEHAILICGYEGGLDLDYYAVCTREQLEAKKKAIKDSHLSWVSEMEDYSTNPNADKDAQKAAEDYRKRIQEALNRLS